MSALVTYTNGAFSDGDYSKEFITGRVPIIDAETGAMMYRVTYQINQADYILQNPGVKRSYALNSLDPATGAYYIDEGGDPRMLENGVMELTRLFSIVPQERDDYESFSMRYQLFITGEGQLVEATITVKSRVHKTYYFTETPEALALAKCYRVFPLVGTSFYQQGTPPGVDDTEMLAEDEKLNRWRGRGNIFVKTSRYVPVFNPSLIS